MTPQQRAAAERLAKWHQAMADEPNRNGAKKEKHAITAALLRELAAEPMQEPAIWIQSNHLQHAKNGPYLARTGPTKLMSDFIPLYAAPQQRKPLSDAFVSQVVRSVQPNLSATCKAWAEQFDECKYWLDAAHEAEQLALPMEDKT